MLFHRTTRTFLLLVSCIFIQKTSLRCLKKKTELKYFSPNNEDTLLELVAYDSPSFVPMLQNAKSFLKHIYFFYGDEAHDRKTCHRCFGIFQIGDAAFCDQEPTDRKKKIRCNHLGCVDRPNSIKRGRKERQIMLGEESLRDIATLSSVSTYNGKFEFLNRFDASDVFDFALDFFKLIKYDSNHRGCAYNLARFLITISSEYVLSYVLIKQVPSEIDAYGFGRLKHSGFGGRFAGMDVFHATYENCNFTRAQITELAILVTTNLIGPSKISYHKLSLFLSRAMAAFDDVEGVRSGYSTQILRLFFGANIDSLSTNSSIEYESVTQLFLFSLYEQAPEYVFEKVKPVIMGLDLKRQLVLLQKISHGSEFNQKRIIDFFERMSSQPDKPNAFKLHLLVCLRVHLPTKLLLTQFSSFPFKLQVQFKVMLSSDIALEGYTKHLLRIIQQVNHSSENLIYAFNMAYRTIDLSLFEVMALKVAENGRFDLLEDTYIDALEMNAQSDTRYAKIMLILETKTALDKRKIFVKFLEKIALTAVGEDFITENMSSMATLQDSELIAQAFMWHLASREPYKRHGIPTLQPFQRMLLRFISNEEKLQLISYLIAKQQTELANEVLEKMQQ